jgi:hypothetical protein
MTESYLLDAGWLFFAALSVVIAIVTLKAFATDLFPSRTPSLPTQDVGPGDSPERKGHLG